MNFKEKVKFNIHYETYGNSKRIKAKFLQIVLITICLITPFTNWIIPFIIMYVKTDIVFRY